MGSKWTLWTAVVVGAGIVAVAARPGVAGPAHRQLHLIACAQLGRTDVARNEVLEFRFSVPLRRDSVNARTLQVNEIFPDGEHPAVGARIVAGNVVRFDPRRTQRNYDEAQLPDSFVVEHNHVYGFSAHATYVVRLRSGADVTTLRAKSGGRLALAVTSSFGTGDRYDDPVPGQPSFIGDHGSGLIGFDPPRIDGNGKIYDYAVAILEFSEPVLPSSMRLGETVIVTRAGAPVAGTLTPDPWSARRWTFAPTGGWSAGADGQPFVPAGYFRFRVTTGVTDLAGNPLKRPFTSR